MFREIEGAGDTARRPSNDGVLRHPDGSINFDAYRNLARRARTEAIASSITGAMRIASRALSSIGSALGGKDDAAAPHQTR